ncbi:hypothetical protein HanPSC8_Chr06g0235641 [Helianthus annuus]|nr:hypothetical protein HanPSC8_Chr06g0235641 [Helianthus annuus]
MMTIPITVMLIINRGSGIIGFTLTDVWRNRSWMRLQKAVLLSLWFVSSNERKEAFAEARSTDADVTTEIGVVVLTPHL